MNHLPELIFDLDGTLIDSAKSILAALHQVFEAAATPPAIPLTETLIGPPLQETLALLSGTTDKAVINAHIAAFQTHYDGGGYKAAEVYPGICDLLKQLRQEGYTLRLATNKRLVPTQKILAHLEWDKIFQSVHTLDQHTPRLANKAALLQHLLQQHQISPSAAIYIGDKVEDGEAATSNALRFIGVSWGYGDFSALPRQEWCLAHSTATLLDQIGHMSRTSGA